MSFSPSAVEELHAHWLPNLSDAALTRLSDLLSGRESLLVQCRWTQAGAAGCLATHAGWNDRRTAHLDSNAGPAWLTEAGIFPGSHVVAEWDAAAPHAYQSWELRSELLQVLRGEQQRRRHAVVQEQPQPAEISV